MSLNPAAGWMQDAAQLLLGEASDSPRAIFPRDLTPAALRCRVSFEAIQPLTLSAAQAFAERQGLTPSPTLCADRRLRGCIIASRGEAIIFTDPDDTAADQRFTLAHELSHYALDYELPRERAVRRLSNSILPVLDGERAPAPSERIDAALEGVKLGTYMALIERDTQGRVEGASVAAAELRADSLALHLLAPIGAVLQRLPQPAYPETARREFQSVAEHVLKEEFGLPERVAADYASRALWPRASRADTRSWLGL